MSSQSEDRWKDLNITEDEVDRIGKALKDEKFRKMFVEYAEEISDPKNRELYEKEIAQMEAEKGMDVQFIHPKPGYVFWFQILYTNTMLIHRLELDFCASPWVDCYITVSCFCYTPN